MWETLKNSLIVNVVATLYRGLNRTWRVKHLRRPDVAGVYAHWHGDELLLVGAFAHQRMAIMASRSKDGERMKRILGRLGYHVVRGSSTRGGAGGLKGLIDVVTKVGYNASLAVDGPRGPIYVVKPGILKLAQATGRPIIPGASAAKRRFIFRRAWNRCYLPTPFTRCVIVYGTPIEVPLNLNDDELETLRLRLETTLLRLKAEAEQTFSRQFSPALLTPAINGV